MTNENSKINGKKYRDWKNVSPDAIDLILKLAEKNPEKRISTDEALKHPWFNNVNY